MSNPGNIDHRPSKRSFIGRPRNIDNYIEHWLEDVEEENNFSDVDDSDFLADEREGNFENEGNREFQEDITRKPNESDESEGFGGGEVMPSYGTTYQPQQERRGMGTGAAVGLGVGALAAGGLAGYALGGGFSSDSPEREEVHVTESVDFGGDDWAE